MGRTISNLLLSLLLLTTMVWGGCLSCAQFFMWPGIKSCCAATGQCKTKSPLPQNSASECKQIALEHQKSPDFHVDLPVVASVVFQSPLPVLDPLMRWPVVSTAAEPSPPDLQILHSTFRI